ncbi:substrate-binding periplasmic protein [Roseateles sp. DC23W]|uniref:Substrate-binding periplasmic protein n=1 Tax=Pelomonas dachongensis TaxID=3299029 RepID=A0ABW7EUA0_9BURK
MPVSTARRLLLCLAAALAAPPALGAEATTVHLATNVERSYFPPAEALLTKAYASLGLKVEFRPWPLPRTQLELRAGRLDGVAMRAEAFFEQSPFMRRVDVPLLELHVYAYARPPCPRSLALAELGQQRVTYQRGMVAAEALVPEAARRPANTPSDAFLNVSTGTADVALVLTTPWMSEVPVDTRDGSLCRVSTPLSRTQLFHGVHESRDAWVQPLTQALRTLKERGELHKAWADYEREVGLPSNRLQALPGRSLTITQPEAPGSALAQPLR